jgi:hypothetical protein
MGLAPPADREKPEESVFAKVLVPSFDSLGGLAARGSAGRLPAGQLSAADRLHQPVVPPRQGAHQPRGGLDPGPLGNQCLGCGGSRLQRLLAKSRLLGSYFSAERERLRQLARQRGVHTIDNVASGTV